ncbi:flavodoxin [Pseudoalteromonas sp. THAF3]|uniref:flavodoxin family protein n=1 Tax=Pseudoalteromonas sp. THAF3 TaxID=2587843 RepID=UPI001268FDC0|nr:hypothetical protein [Pseudoalteromonas sp. THAF3]QFU04827.1 flavodoxin [Pseudoalteromonas sp. THAF3]
MIKWLMILLALAVVTVLVVLFAVTRVENAQYENNKSRLNSSPKAANQKTKVAVVVFSRSGNTGVVAQHIADKYQGDIYEIFDSGYELGVPGLISALSDARSDIATITPNHIDLKQYDTIFLGSPIWLYSPAPPIWQFAKDHQFNDKKVVLFNTFNSKFEQYFIDDFEQLVRSNGATAFSHRYVKRGRMGSQITTEELLEQFDAQLDSL